MGLLCIATIFSTFAQAMLYGAFLNMVLAGKMLIRWLSGFAVLMFILTMWILLGTHRRRKPNVVMVGSSCTVMLLATAVRLQFSVPTAIIRFLIVTTGDGFEHGSNIRGLCFEGAITSWRARAIFRQRFHPHVRYQELFV